MSLTKRQQAIYDFIADHVDRHGWPPTRAQIVKHFKFSSPNAAQCHLKALERQGVIELIQGTARGIRVIARDSNPASAKSLPVIGRVSAGRPILAVEHQQAQLSVDPSAFSPKPHFLLKVNGDSMIDAGINDGDMLVVHKTPEARTGQIVVARIDDEITVKELKRRGRGIELVAHNPAYPPIKVRSGQEFAVEGLAVGVIRSFSNGQALSH